MGLWRRVALAVAALGFLVVAIGWQLGWFSGGAKLGPETEVPPPPSAFTPEAVARVEARILTRYFSAVGSVTAREKSQIAARIRGVVQAVLVRAGDLVEQGDLLVRLEEETTRAQVGQAKKALEAAEARLERAEQSHERVAFFFAAEAATEQRLEAARAGRDAARAEAARARHTLAEARVVRSRTEVRAPVRGEVAERRVDPGDLAHPGAPLLVVHTREAVRLTVFVREGLALHVEVGDEVPVRIPQRASRLGAASPRWSPRSIRRAEPSR